MSRRDIYYWKCDRPAAFHGTQTRREPDAAMEQQLRDALQQRLNARRVELSAGAGQGNHVTWNADVDGTAMFVRVENGPEKDGQLAVESSVLDRVREAGVPTPRVFACDASRTRVPFAWQALERIGAPDLNHWFKAGTLNQHHVAFGIGVAVALWQSIRPEGFGPFDPAHWRSAQRLSAFHSSYPAYFGLRLDQHLGFLVERGFLTHEQRRGLALAIDDHQHLLRLDQGCLVHKDLALWNILGSADAIAAFIDFDDAISGDPMDDLSLLGCFHDGAFLARAIEGYQSIRPLPDEHRRRFWLHLLRNMIVKSVIRVGAGYFDRDDGFFLIGAGSSGQDLREFTLARLQAALQGLRENADISTL
jgi:fructosamine-3-kinase